MKTPTRVRGSLGFALALMSIGSFAQEGTADSLLAAQRRKDVRASAAATQRDYDQAAAEIQRLYRERQPASNPNP